MKYFGSIFFLFILFNLSYSLAAPILEDKNKEIEEEFEINDDIEDKNEQNKETEAIKPRKYSDSGAMKEHVKIKNNAKIDLEKNKEEFEKRIDKELYLLRAQ